MDLRKKGAARKPCSGREAVTLGDLFAGAWTWGQLARELAPIAFAVSAAFFAGYERGRNRQIQEAKLWNRTPVADECQ